jgi:hypothetical protein
LRKARFVACDETGARIEGVNAYHWVFCRKQAVAYCAGRAQCSRRPSPCRVASDRYSAQPGHADR